jgi:hypothetical protein
MSAGRGRQSVANLNDSVVGRPLEADPADGVPIRALRDPVVAERALLAVTLGGGDESAQGHDVAVERVVSGPLVLSCRGPVVDAPCFRGVDRVQDQASCLYIGHGRSQRANPQTSNRFDYRLSVHGNVSGSATAISGIGIAGECAGDVNRHVSEALGYY